MLPPNKSSWTPLLKSCMYVIFVFQNGLFEDPNKNWGENIIDLQRSPAWNAQ